MRSIYFTNILQVLKAQHPLNGVVVPHAASPPPSRILPRVLSYPVSRDESGVAACGRATPRAVVDVEVAHAWVNRVV